MYDSNSLAIQWPDIRYYGYKDWEDYLGENAKQEEEQASSQEMESNKKE